MSMNPFLKGCAWIEGKYLPIAQARIPILDTGFLRSDVTYDVAAVWKGRFFRLEDHLDRFEASWRRLRMEPSLSREEMRAILLECVARSGLRDAFVEMILSRGVDRHGVRDPRRFENCFYAYAIPYVWLVKPEDQELGTHLIIARNTVRIPPRSIDPTVKNFQWGDLVRAQFEAYDKGGHTAVLSDADGNLTDGPGFNLFACHDGTLLTPSHGVLQGITRRTVLDLAGEQGIATNVTMFNAQVLRAASEIFLTSTAGGVMPVTTLDGCQVGNGKPGSITMLLRRRYWEAQEKERWTVPVEYPSHV